MELPFGDNGGLSIGVSVEEWHPWAGWDGEWTVSAHEADEDSLSSHSKLECSSGCHVKDYFLML